MNNTIEFFMADSFSVGIQQKPFILISNQIKVWDGFQTDFPSFIIKPVFCRDFFTKFKRNKIILYELTTPKPSSRKQVILIPFILQCFTRRLITFVNINGADVSPNGRAVNIKQIFPPTSHEKLRTFWCGL